MLNEIINKRRAQEVGVLTHMEDFAAGTCVSVAFTHKLCAPSAQALPGSQPMVLANICHGESLAREGFVI